MEPEYFIRFVGQINSIPAKNHHCRLQSSDWAGYCHSGHKNQF